MQIKKDERNEIKSTSHSRYRCQYHIVFAPKYRRKEIYGQLKKDIGEILRTLCKQKNVEILEAEACVDHIHMLVSIPPYLSVAQFMGFLKGKSSLMIFDRHANLKYKYGSRNFWCRGYYVDTVGRNKKIIAEHIRNQLEEDYAADQISIKEYVDPFTGRSNHQFTGGYDYCVQNGFPATGVIGFGTSLTIWLRRIPKPPAKTIASIKPPARSVRFNPYPVTSTRQRTYAPHSDLPN